MLNLEDHKLVKQWIKEIINDNSGGLKFTELVSSISYFLGREIAVEEIEQAISTMYPDVMVLEGGFIMTYQVRFRVREGESYYVEDNRLDRICCYCDTQADAANICCALNSQEKNILAQLEIPFNERKENV